MYLRLFSLLFCAVMVFCTALSAQMVVGSLNTQGLGTSREKDLTLLAQIVRNEHFDVLALQEVFKRDRGEEFNTVGVKALTDTLGSDWAYQFSRTRSGNEYYAYIWNRNSVSEVLFEFTGIVEYQQSLIRPPFVKCFSHKGKEYALINTHVIFGVSSDTAKRIDELRVLARIYDSVYRRYDTTLLLGDFNLSASEINAALKGEKLVCYQTSKTTVGDNRYVNDYDHFVMAKDVFSALSPSFERVKGPEVYCSGNFAKYKSSISDHVPIKLVVP